MVDEEPDTTPEDETAAGFRLAVVGVIIAAFSAFVAQNTASTQVDWLVFDFSLPLWALLIASAGVGLVVGQLIGWTRRRR